MYLNKKIPEDNEQRIYLDSARERWKIKAVVPYKRIRHIQYPPDGPDGKSFCLEKIQPIEPDKPAIPNEIETLHCRNCDDLIFDNGETLCKFCKAIGNKDRYHRAIEEYYY